MGPHIDDNTISGKSMDKTASGKTTSGNLLSLPDDAGAAPRALSNTSLLDAAGLAERSTHSLQSNFGTSTQSLEVGNCGPTFTTVEAKTPESEDPLPRKPVVQISIPDK